MDPLLQVSKLYVSLNNQLILDDISFELHKKETLAVIGPNGAGKTTLFRALLGLIPYSGKIEWKKGIKIGYVPQRLFIERDIPLTVGEFFSLQKEKVFTEEVNRVLKVVGFEDEAILGKTMGVLSGGEIQRVLIAWALCNHPDVLLFDEPTSGVDVSAEISIYGMLNDLHKTEDFAIILISHELEVVDKYATKVICLSKSRICYGVPHEVLVDKTLTDLFGKDITSYHHHE